MVRKPHRDDINPDTITTGGRYGKVVDAIHCRCGNKIFDRTDKCRECNEKNNIQTTLINQNKRITQLESMLKSKVIIYE